MCWKAACWRLSEASFWSIMFDRHEASGRHSSPLPLTYEGRREELLLSTFHKMPSWTFAQSDHFCHKTLPPPHSAPALPSVAFFWALSPPHLICVIFSWTKLCCTNQMIWTTLLCSLCVKGKGVNVLHVSTRMQLAERFLLLNEATAFLHVVN